MPDAFVGEANAIIGRPITPVSYAGVARRTSRRVVRRNVAYSSAAAATYTAAPAPAPAQFASPPADKPAGAPPIGTVVNQLPSGCVSSPRNGIEYFNCGGVYYRPVVQGNNLVYMVETP
jgi:hypothetical protein